MITLYLHIGTPKTGTSAIQRTLSCNRTLLEKQRIAFPDLGLKYAGAAEGRNGHFLSEKDDPEERDYVIAMEKLRKIFEEGYDKIILSEENLWADSGRLSQFVQEIRANDVSVKIIVYLRRQDLFMQSQYAQHVKKYMRMTFEAYENIQKIRLDYYKYLQQYADLVGKDNLIVRVYERQQFLDRDLITDFFAQVGIRDREQFTEAEYVNESLSGVYLETKRLLNRNNNFQNKGDFKNNFVVGYLKRAAANAGSRASFSENLFFSYEKQMEFLRKFQDSNEKVAREFLGREDGILFRDNISVPEKEVIKSRKYKLIKFLTEKLDMEKQLRQYVADLDKDHSSRQFSKVQCVDVCGEVMVMQQEQIEELKRTIQEMSPEYFEKE